MSEVEQASDEHSAEPPQKKGSGLLFKLATWLLTFVCFYLVFGKIEAAAARDGMTTLEYLIKFFGDADWVMWLSIMVPYSIFFFLVDSHATWRAIRWFNAPNLKLTNVLPIRASAYILSLVNEQVGKGAMSLYLLKRHKVPGWQALSTMVMMGLMEIYQLLLFSALVAGSFSLGAMAAPFVDPVALTTARFLIAGVVIAVAAHVTSGVSRAAFVAL